MGAIMVPIQGTILYKVTHGFTVGYHLKSRWDGAAVLRCCLARRTPGAISILRGLGDGAEFCIEMAQDEFF